MLFNSFAFILFFPLVTIIYFLLPNKCRWLHLLIASCIFYMAFIPVYVLILFFTIAVDYIAGLLIEKAEGRRRTLFLVMSIVANVGVLAFFKYYNFAVSNIDSLLHYSGSMQRIPLLKIILPIGLSFHTFQAMSYTIEVYRGNQKAEKHLGIYALYVMFYPQLMAGPIERPQNMLHQFREKHSLDYDNLTSGLRRMAWGMLKKIVIADRLALIVDPVYKNPHEYSGTTLLIASVFFAFQIYCDFSGYTDIALGAAKVMGFKLMENFNYPFLSKSITEFWRRWHISLTTWFYDYIFNPVVASLRDWGRGAVIVGLLITFSISGIWHGAGWNFIAYGVMHGIVICYEYLTRKQRKQLFSKLPAIIVNSISRIFVIAFLIFSWVFFRSKNVAEALFILRKIGHVPAELGKLIKTKSLAFLQLPDLSLTCLCIGLIIFLQLSQAIQRKYNFAETFARKPAYIRWGLYYLGMFFVLGLGVFKKAKFIYFQF